MKPRAVWKRCEDRRRLPGVGDRANAVAEQVGFEREADRLRVDRGERRRDDRDPRPIEIGRDLGGTRQPAGVLQSESASSASR